MARLAVGRPRAGAARPRGRWARLPARAVGWAVLVALLGLGAWALWPVPALEVADATTGRPLAWLSAPVDGVVALTYLHSLYGQPAREEFIVTPAGLQLVRLASPSLAVLEYYGRPEPPARVGAEYTIAVAPCPVDAPCAEGPRQELAVLASARGRRSLEVAGRVVPLYRLGATDDRVTLRLGWAPRLAVR
jgi:hypothetical protein